MPSKSKILISLENSPAFIEVFFGCLLSGNIPIPLVHHSMLPFGKFKKLISNIAEKSLQPDLLISDTHFPFFNKLDSLSLKKESSISVYSAHLPKFSKNWSFPHQSQGDDVALIQFSSGSTAHPKGVLLTHRAIMENIKQILHKMEIKKNDKLCTWLPFYHDMGLIGGLLAPLASQHPIVLSTPQEFIQFPELGSGQ